MPPVEQVPKAVGVITLVAGAALLAAPQTYTKPVGLEGQDLAIRAVGLADLVLVPGLLRGRPRWPWMVGRAALSIGQAAYCGGVASQAKSPAAVRGSAAMLVALGVMDATTALLLRRRQA